MKDSEYMDAISDALDSAYHLIVLSTSKENVTSKWVKFEWTTFLNEKLNNRKDGQIMTLLDDMSVGELPLQLRYFESFTLENYRESLLSYVETPDYLARQKERRLYKSNEHKYGSMIQETLAWQKATCIEENKWENLIQDILNGDVIPIIGPDFLIDNANIHIKLIEAMAGLFNVKSSPTTFSELINDIEYLKANNNDRNSIYLFIRQLCELNAPKQKPSKLLVRLLESRLFPFVITTSFFPIVEQTMNMIWGDDLRIMNFSNNPFENNDIKGRNDFTKPTIYYMLGRGDNLLPHRFVVTDEDFMDFISSWRANDYFIAPINLKEQLKKKKLLFIGNTIDKTDFLMLIKSINEKLSDCTYVFSYNQDPELIYYLLNQNVFVYNNIEEFVSVLLDRLHKMQYDIKTKNSGECFDIYISSHKDNAISQELCKRLKEKGLTVKTIISSLNPAENIMCEMKQSIRNSSFFVPILTKSIEEEQLETHFCRREWEEAIEVSKLYGRQFIIPVIEQGLDIFSLSIPKEFAQQNIVSYQDEVDIERVVTFITNIMPQIL